MKNKKAVTVGRVFIGVVLILFSTIFALVGCNEKEDDKTGSLSVVSNPEGASIFIDGEYTSRQTPSAFELDVGDYVVRASIPGFVPSPDSIIVHIEAGESEEAVFTFVEDTSAGYIMVITDPPGASIFVNDALVRQRTPYTVLASPGDHTVRVERSGFQPASQVVSVTPGVSSNADFGLLSGHRMVLIEDFTNTYCSNCPDASDNIMRAIRSGFEDRVVLVEYHPSDGGTFNRDIFFQNNPEGNNARFHDFYDFVGVPRVVIDGALTGLVTEEGGDRLVVEAIETALARPHVLDIWGSWNYSRRANISLRAISSVNAKIWGVVYRKEINFDSPPGSNGLVEFHNVLYDLLTEEAVISLPAGGEQSFEFSFDIADSLLDEAKIGVCVFVQSDDKTVHQSVELIYE